MRWFVQLKDQPSPSHKTSAAFAAKLLECGLARKAGQNTIALRTLESWASIKARFRPVNGKLPADQLLAPLDHYLPYNYPLPYASLKNYEARP